MFRATIALAAIGLIAAVGQASAQDVGGVRPRGTQSFGSRPVGSQAVFGRIASLQPGCPLSQTNVAVGVNPVTGAGAQSQQQLFSQGGSCRPLVTTQVAAGINIAAGAGSSASQSVGASSQRGLLATTSIGRGVNIAAGPRSSAGQLVFSQTGR